VRCHDELIGSIDQVECDVVEKRHADFSMESIRTEHTHNIMILNETDGKSEAEADVHYLPR